MRTANFQTGSFRHQSFRIAELIFKLEIQFLRLYSLVLKSGMKDKHVIIEANQTLGRLLDGAVLKVRDDLTRVHFHGLLPLIIGGSRAVDY